MANARAASTHQLTNPIDATQTRECARAARACARAPAVLCNAPLPCFGRVGSMALARSRFARTLSRINSRYTRARSDQNHEIMSARHKPHYFLDQHPTALALASAHFQRSYTLALYTDRDPPVPFSPASCACAHDATAAHAFTIRVYTVECPRFTRTVPRQELLPWERGATYARAIPC